MYGGERGAVPRDRGGFVRVAGAVVLSAGFLLAAVAPGAAQDKNQYTIFNPTPDNLLRDMSTDRPDTTESPFTVDAGHVQFESTIFGYSRSRRDDEGTITKGYEYGTTNIRIGLTNWAEFGVVVAPYGVVKTRPLDPLEATRVSGPGGVDLRMKFNFWGNDTFEKAGATAFALLPFLTLPTDRDNGISPSGVEGGLIVPFAVKLTDKFSLGVNGGFHIVRNEDAPGTHTEWLASASLAYEWNEKLSTYYELASRYRQKDAGGDISVFGTGFTYKLAKNVQLDAGINFGLTRAADQINPFVGISARF